MSTNTWEAAAVAMAARRVASFALSGTGALWRALRGGAGPDQAPEGSFSNNGPSDCGRVGERAMDGQDRALHRGKERRSPGALRRNRRVTAGRNRRGGGLNTGAAPLGRRRRRSKREFQIGAFATLSDLRRYGHPLPRPRRWRSRLHPVADEHRGALDPRLLVSRKHAFNAGRI